jgi:hypothetical protein
MFTCGGVVVLSRLGVLSALLGRWLRSRLVVIAFVGEIRFCFPGHKYVFLAMSFEFLDELVSTGVNGLAAEDWMWSFIFC